MKQEITHPYRRRRHFVDPRMQGRLLWGLIGLELLLFTIAMFVIYFDMQRILEESLYRVHQQLPSGRPLLLQALWVTVPWVVGNNILLVLYVDSIWKKALRPIISQLQEILIKVKRLDLRHRVDHAEEHEVLQSANEWLKKERERYSTIAALSNGLPEDVEINNKIMLEKLQSQLQALREELPKP